MIFVPGRYEQRGNANVWIRDRWEPIRPGDTWIVGGWANGTWADGRWKSGAPVDQPLPPQPGKIVKGKKPKPKSD
jgi:hypothetical protein